MMEKQSSAPPTAGMMHTVRFSKTAGKPILHVLWIDPAKNIILQKAIKANRVMTIHQRPVGAKNDAEFQKDCQWLKQDTPGV